MGGLRRTAGLAVRLQLDLIEVAKSMPRVVNGALPSVRAGEDFDAFETAILVHLLDTPNVADDAVAEDFGA
jgi:hypothetical protein